jgi:hypothetical protein
MFFSEANVELQTLGALCCLVHKVKLEHMLARQDTRRPDEPPSWGGTLNQ